MTPTLEHLMFRKIAPVALLTSALVSSVAAAQSLSDVPTTYIGSVAIGSGITTLSGAAARSVYVGTSDRFRVGLNIRATAASTNGFNLAPVDPRGAIGPTTDTLSVSGTVLTLNLGVNARIDITERLYAGLNLDMFGATTGPRENGAYRATPGGTAKAVSTKPTGANIFAGGTGDRGSLNSEFFLAWTLNDRTALRGGLSHQLVEYDVNVEDVTSAASKFRRYANLVFVGITFTRPQ